MMLAAGTRLGSYEILDSIGAGAATAFASRSNRASEPVLILRISAQD